MNASDGTNFLYLNREGSWAGFELSGLTVDSEGTLRLASLPLLEGEPPAGLDGLAPPAGPAGIAFGPDNSPYFTEPARHLVLRLDSCSPDQGPKPIPCAGGEGSEPTQFRGPTGLLYHPIRRALLVADSGNDRVQLFNLDSFQLVDIWGGKGSEPGSFDAPQALAGDPEGNVYIVDYGNKRVQKFDLRGGVLPAFWLAVQETLTANHLTLAQPSAVAVGPAGGTGIEVFVLDSATCAVYAFGEDGTFLRRFTDASLHKPVGLAAGAAAVYVGDNPEGASGHVYQFGQSGASFDGPAVGYRGPVAALALDTGDGLWVHTGSGLLPVRLNPDKGFARSGFMYGGPFSNPGAEAQDWHLLQARLSPLGSDSHIQFFVFVSPCAAPPPAPAGGPPWANASVPLAACFVPGKWIAIPPDVDAAMVPASQPDPNNPDRQQRLICAWIGAEFKSEGRSSPALSQIRFEFDHQTYLEYLPAIYSAHPKSRRFLSRLLSLFETVFNDVEQEISTLSRLFDSAAAPPDWLDWLAAWLGLDLNDEWSPALKRQVIVQALDASAARGTVEGLRQALRTFAGVEARIEEPILDAAWWSLPENQTLASVQSPNSVLGFTTMLAPAQAQGAVLGTTAVLDASHLLTDQDFGAPLFEDLAYQFSVLVYRGQINSDLKLKQVRALIDQEKPAHTACQLCVVEPRMRVGFQAKVGIDSVIAGPPGPTPLGVPGASHPGLILGGTPPGRISGQNRIGVNIMLDEAAVDGPTLGR